jgi:hypothetical protein
MAKIWKAGAPPERRGPPKKRGCAPRQKSAPAFGNTIVNVGSGIDSPPDATAQAADYEYLANLRFARAVTRLHALDHMSA